MLDTYCKNKQTNKQTNKQNKRTFYKGYFTFQGILFFFYKNNSCLDLFVCVGRYILYS